MRINLNFKLSGLFSSLFVMRFPLIFQKTIYGGGGLTEKSHKFLLATKLIFHDFIKFSRKRPCIETSLMQFNFFKLPIRCILNLTVIPSREVLQFSTRRRSYFESSRDLHQFYRNSNANKLQSHYKFQSSVIFSVLFD